ISERKAFEEQLAHHAFHDTLTGLPNRTLFHDRVERALARAVRQGHYIAILFLDLDRFKVVNDSLGHGLGDELLIQVAQRLQDCVDEESTVARLGGDEFTILLEKVTDVTHATHVAERIATALRAPVTLEHRTLFITTSIGIVLNGSEHSRPDDLLRDADVAMYRAKARGKAQYEVYDASMNTQALERLELETDLRQAVERGEFEIYYQPLVLHGSPSEGTPGRIIGTEALIRWQHPRHGLVSPGKFIPLAEEMGLILPMGQWILKEACQQLRKWQRAFPGDPPLLVSVNLSARQFQQATLVAQIAQVLQESSLLPKCLKLEITESVLMEDAAATLETLRRLKELGVQLSVDDFGTGYSSLSYLKRFPIDMLKIDRSFVQGLEDKSGDRAIVLAIISLAHTLNLEVIAEGVETRQQATILHEMGCKIGQGYYFARPMPAAELTEHLQAGFMPSS
ncbi:MAG: EAL domain-containing protein, partial [Ardenticatenales bacterium]|nr:EAL domain-containing protein [Ardenticatenales bacterium]